MKKSTRIIIIVLIVIVASVLVYLAWRYFLSPKFISPLSQEAGETKQDKPLKVIDERIFDYWINQNTEEIYYITIDGLIYKISSSGENQNTGSRATGNLSYIKPSFDGSSILVAFGYPQNPTFAIHNLVNKTWQALPAGTTAAVWDPNSENRLVYLKDNGATSRLYLFTTLDGKSRELLRLAQKDLDLDWVLPNLIYFKERPSSKMLNSLWSYDLNTKNIKLVVKEEPGLVIKWNPLGDIGIKWSSSVLKIINRDNDLLMTVRLKTLPTKCTFYAPGVYCAAAKDQDALPSSLTPDNYLKGDIKFDDDIYSISLSELLRQSEISALRLFKTYFADSSIDAVHLEVKDDVLFFINRYDKKLYSLSL